MAQSRNIKVPDPEDWLSFLEQLPISFRYPSFNLISDLGFRRPVWP